MVSPQPNEAELNRHLFNALYHALALIEHATLATADHHYFRKSKNRGSVYMLADFDAGA